MSRAARAYDRGKAATILTLWSTYRQAVVQAQWLIDNGDEAGGRAHLGFAAGVRQEIDNLIGHDPATGSEHGLHKDKN